MVVPPYQPQGQRIALSRRAALGLMGAGMSYPWTLWAAPLSPIRMVYFEDYEPISFRQSDGSMGGVLIDCITLLANEIRVPVSHTGFPWERAQALVQTGSYDGLCTVPTSTRREYCLFTDAPVLQLDFGVFFRADHPRRNDIERIETLDDLHKFSIVDYQGNGWTKTVLATLPILWNPTQEGAIRMVAASRADLIIGQISAINHIMRKQHIEPELVSTSVRFASPVRYHFGLRKTYPDVSAIMARINAKVPALQQSFSAILAATS